MGLVKYWRGHPVRDTDIAANMDVIDAAYQDGVKVAKGDLEAGLVNSIAFAWQNPESSAILVQRVIIDVTTIATTAGAIMDVGVVASATATAATIFDDIAIHTKGVYDHLFVSGAGAGGVHKMDANGGSNDYITGKALTQASTGLVGKYYIEYVVV